MTIRFSRTFSKAFAKCPKEVKQRFKERLVIFSKAPAHPLLNNHALSGRLRAYRSINLSGDWRALFKVEKDIVSFVAIGTHSQLYR